MNQPGICENTAVRVKEEQGAPAGLEIGVNAERCGMQGRVSIPCDVHMCWWVGFFLEWLCTG